MSFRFFQGLIEQLRDIVGYEFGVIDANGIVVAASDGKREGECANNIYLELIKLDDGCFFEKDGVLYQKVYLKNKFEFIIYMKSDAKDAKKLLGLLAMNIKNSKIYYDEKYNKINFIRSIVTDNILMSDITVRARELHIKNEELRQVLLVNVDNQKDMQIYDILCNLFPNKLKNFVVSIDEESIVIIKELDEGLEKNDANKIAETIISTIETEVMQKARVGISSIVDNIRDIHRAYKEAEMAITIGKIFEKGKNIINYNKLGIGRLIYQLPTTLCKLFLSEVFREGTFETLDSETLFTIQKFFENNLNVSETARQLFIHRNTLVYRLDKIQKITGLDLRMFDDAIIFKVAMLVKNYLNENENLKYK